MAFAPGAVLGSYQIVAPLGTGGMGEVYRARDRKLGRDVAIKVLPERVATDPEALAIHDFGREGGMAHAVMELLEGQTLRELLEAGPIPVRRGIELALQMAQGLAAAHERGIVHRDLKPENVFLTRDGHLKILDFGLARRKEHGSDGSDALTRTRHTEPGAVIGTAGYMKPDRRSASFYILPPLRRPRPSPPVAPGSRGRAIATPPNQRTGLAPRSTD